MEAGRREVASPVESPQRPSSASRAASAAPSPAPPPRPAYQVDESVRLSRVTGELRAFPWKNSDSIDDATLDDEAREARMRKPSVRRGSPRPEDYSSGRGQLSTPPYLGHQSAPSGVHTAAKDLLVRATSSVTSQFVCTLDAASPVYVVESVQLGATGKRTVRALVALETAKGEADKPLGWVTMFKEGRSNLIGGRPSEGDVMQEGSKKTELSAASFLTFLEAGGANMSASTPGSTAFPLSSHSHEAAMKASISRSPSPARTLSSHCYSTACRSTAGCMDS